MFSYVKTYPLSTDPFKSLVPRRLRPAGEVLGVPRQWSPLDELVLADWAMEQSLDGKFAKGEEAYKPVQSRLSVPRSAAAIRVQLQRMHGAGGLAMYCMEVASALRCGYEEKAAAAEAAVAAAGLPKKSGRGGNFRRATTVRAPDFQ